MGSIEERPLPKRQQKSVNNLTNQQPSKIDRQKLMVIAIYGSWVCVIGLIFINSVIHWIHFPQQL